MDNTYNAFYIEYNISIKKTSHGSFYCDQFLEYKYGWQSNIYPCEINAYIIFWEKNTEM